MQHKKSVSFLLAIFMTAQVLSGSIFAAGNGAISDLPATTNSNLLGGNKDSVQPPETTGYEPSEEIKKTGRPSVTTDVYIKQPLPEKPSLSLELKDKRTPNSKTFQLEDNTYETVISTEMLHYQDHSGKWQDISLLFTDEADIAGKLDSQISHDALPELPALGIKDSLSNLGLTEELSKLKKDAYRALKVPFDVRIGKKFTQGYEIGKGSDRLSFVPVGAGGARATVQQDVYGNSVIHYSSAWTATDVDLQLIPKGIKETLVLTSPAAPSSFSYEVAGGLTEELQVDNLQIEPAWLEDAAGRYRDVRQTLRHEGGKVYLDLQPDLSGLTYPVRIDPTVVLRSTNNATQDTTVNAHEPDRNYGTAPRLYTGKDINGNQYRSLLQFDLSQIPQGEYNVLDAYLSLHQTPENQYEAFTEVRMQRITKAWDESTVSWNTQPGYAVNADGQSYSTSMMAGEGTQVLYMPELAEEWINGLYPNYGVELHSDMVAAPNVKKFVSADTTALDQHPSFTIRYTMPDQTWNGTTASSDSLSSFNQKKIDYTSDGYKWMLVRDGDEIRLDGMKPEENTWFHSGSHTLGAANGSMYIDQDNYLHLAYKTVGGGIKYVRGTYNSTAHRWTLGTPVIVSSDTTVNVPDLVAHRAVSGGGWIVHIVSSKNNASTNGALYNKIDISSTGSVGTPGAPVVLDSGSKGVPTWPSIDFRHTPAAVSGGKAVKDGAPNLYVAWNAGDAGAGLGIRYKEASFSGGTWIWAGEQGVDENQYTTSERDWFLSVYDGSRSVVFGSLRNALDQQNLLAYTMQAGSKVINMFYGAVPVGKQALYGSGSYDAQGNLYFGGLSGAEGDFITFKWARASKALSLPVLVTPHLGTSYLTMKRGDSNNRIELATSTESAIEVNRYELEHSVILDTIERQFTQYSYDAASRLKYILMQNGDGIAFTYDAAGNLTRRELDAQPDTNGTNLLVNGGFEVTEQTPGTSPGVTDPNYGWKTYTEPGSTVSFTHVDTPVSRGNKAMKLQVSGLPQNKSNFVYQTIGVTAGQPFRLSGKVNKQALSQASASLSVEFLSANMTVLGSYEQQSTGVNTSFETLQKKGRIPSGTVYAKIYVKIKSLAAGASGTLYADEIKLEYESNNLLWNPGFERTRDGQLIEWGTYIPPGAGTTFLPVSEAYEGSKGLKLTASGLSSGAYTFVHQTIGIGAGESFGVGAHYMAENLTGGSGVLAVQFLDGNGGTLGWLEQTGTAGSAYNGIGLSGTAPAGAAYIKVMLGIKGTASGGQGTVYLDRTELSINQP